MKYSAFLIVWVFMTVALGAVVEVRSQQAEHLVGLAQSNFYLNLATFILIIIILAGMVYGLRMMKETNQTLQKIANKNAG